MRHHIEKKRGKNGNKLAIRNNAGKLTEQHLKVLKEKTCLSYFHITKIIFWNKIIISK